jgi:VanZ family protein
LNVKSFWRTITWTIIIIVLCSLPGSQFPKGNFLNIPHLDKWVHGSLYFIWGFLCLYEFCIALGRQNKYLLKTFFIGMLLGGLVELYQHTLIPNRMGDVWDFLANDVGLILSLITFYYYTKKRDNELTV